LASWFTNLTGMRDDRPATVRAGIRHDDGRLTLVGTGRQISAGHLTLPSLAELRLATVALPTVAATFPKLTEVVANVTNLHTAPENRNALFQVASQFNLLEMVSPEVTPEDGIARYGGDATQGPACAMACAGGTIYRNYLVPLGDQIGQSRDRQIDCLADLGAALGNHANAFWSMRNGYALAQRRGLAALNARLHHLDRPARDALMGQLRIGVQAGTEVTANRAGHLVTQAFCSALPVAYCDASDREWEPFARLVLEASYEACLLAAAANLAAQGSPVVYLTLLGGGAFGNRMEWIFDALARAIDLPAARGLDLRIVSHGQPSPLVARFIASFPR